MDTPLEQIPEAAPAAPRRGRRRSRGPRVEIDVTSMTVEEVVVSHADLVHRTAHRYIRATGGAVDLDDLLSVGVMGLIEAHQLYDPSGGRPFRVYAEFRVRGSILDELRRLDPMSQSMRRKVKAYSRAKAELTTRLQRDPTEEELGAHLEVDGDEVQRLQRGADHRYVPIDKTSPAEILAGMSGGRVEDTQLRVILGTAIEELPERDQKILALYYFQDMTMKDIGRVLSLTEARISQLHKEAVKKLRGILERDELNGTC